jgi:hypothetical protein
MEATMATKITVVLEDDLVGGPADETVRFGIGGTDYEIDLNAKNASAFRQQLAPYIEQAPPDWQRTAAAAGADCGQPGTERGHPGLGEDQGIALSDRGRIPASIVQQYQAATGGR